MTYPGNDLDNPTGFYRPECLPDADALVNGFVPEAAATFPANAGYEPKSARTEALVLFAGGVAHNINDLLTSIGGNCEKCLAMPEGQGPMLEGLIAIRIAGERASRLTRQFLAYGRRQVLVPASVDLNALLAGIAERHLQGISPNVAVQTSPGTGVGKVRVDPSQIGTAILNIAINALEAMPSGGMLTLATRRAAAGFAVVEVCDTGIGMDEALISRIFDPFFTTKSVKKGVGLGLSAAQGIVLQSGGSIQVYSKPGIGSAFRIFLPLADPDAAGDIRTAVVKAPEGETILLVEDEDIVRRFCKMTLEIRGYRVLEARNGPEALDMMSESDRPIRLLLTDLIMPGMPGEILAGHFLDANPTGTVLLMSALPKSMMVMEGISNPRIHFIQKPFLGGTLADQVRKCLEKRLAA